MNYKTHRWAVIRQSILRRDGYQCQHFIRYGKHKQADMVHHVFPADAFPEYSFEPWNLISLSNEAHNMMHDRNTNELTAEGVSLLRRICRKYGKEIPMRYRE